MSIQRVLEKRKRTEAGPGADDSISKRAASDDYLEVVAFYEAKREFETAVRWLEKVIGLTPLPFEAQLRGARLLLQAGRPEEAVSFLAPALPRTDAERADKARAYVDAGRPDLAFIESNAEEALG